MAAGKLTKLNWVISCFLVAFLFYQNIKKGEFALNEKAKEQKNAYMKEWREKNKDKVKAAQDRYWEKKFKEKESEKVW